MPTITDTPPTAEAGQLAALAGALDEQVPARSIDRNLLIATWNIRAFGGLTDRWRAGGEDSPKRDLLGLAAITEIMSRFDVIAVQEVRGNLRALRHMLRLLNHTGSHWGVILTDVTKGPRGNDERMAFVFDTRRVTPSGLACELVVPDRDDVDDDAFERQFARTPYAVSFLSGTTTFILVTLHVLYGEKPQDRLGELSAIAAWLAEWAADMHSWHHNLIALGDFNIDRTGDPLYQAFTSTGLSTPAELDAVPRTIFGGGTGHHYDQIAWFTGANHVPALTLDYTGRAGGFDFTGHVHTDLTRRQQSWRISDHLPLWVEFHAPT